MYVSSYRFSLFSIGFATLENSNTFRKAEAFQKIKAFVIQNASQNIH